MPPWRAFLAAANHNFPLRPTGCATFLTPKLAGVVALVVTPQPRASFVTIWTSTTFTTPSPFKSASGGVTPKDSLMTACTSATFPVGLYPLSVSIDGVQSPLTLNASNQFTPQVQVSA